NTNQDGPRHGPGQFDDIERDAGELAERRPGPEVAVVGVGAPGPDIEVLAAGGVGEAEERLVGNAEDDVPASDPGQFRQCPVWFVQVFEDLEAVHDIERIVGLLDVVDVPGGDVRPG